MNLDNKWRVGQGGESHGIVRCVACHGHVTVDCSGPFGLRKMPKDFVNDRQKGPHAIYAS